MKIKIEIEIEEEEEEEEEERLLLNAIPEEATTQV